ncbi:MAG TPA: type II toxin-antitoxin system VapC family toxin [Solirubrobacteraceae bacterium]|nr:type II toxin-antitoxin system VapC family toxin [Solirubrobacteraceae bacterium]
MKFLLDSNAVIALLKGHTGFLARLREHQPQDFGVPAIVAHELFYGAYKGQRTQESLARIDALAFEVLEFDREDARVAGELRAGLARAGTPIGPYDVLIGGQALARNLILVTHNRGEFQRIAELRIEDWE